MSPKQASLLVGFTLTLCDNYHLGFPIALSWWQWSTGHQTGEGGNFQIRTKAAIKVLQKGKNYSPLHPKLSGYTRFARITKAVSVLYTFFAALHLLQNERSASKREAAHTPSLLEFNIELNSRRTLTAGNESHRNALSQNLTNMQ